MADSNKIVYFKGPVKWAKVFEFNRDKGEYAPAHGMYTINIGLDNKDTKMVKGWNRLYTGNEDNDLTYFQFKRKHEHYNKEDEVIDNWSGPPVVCDAENFAWGGKLIGNGSVCTVKLAVNKVGNKTFVRLEGVRVEEHVEYEGEERAPVEEVNHTDGLPF